jgi:hypothetical protein
MAGFIELFVKVKGHFDFDVTNPADVKRVYVNRPTIIKTVLSEEGILDTMKERGIPRNRAIEDLFVEGSRQNVRPEDIISISSEDDKALDRIAGLYGVPKAKLGQDDLHNPKHVKPIETAESEDA